MYRTLLRSGTEEDDELSLKGEASNIARIRADPLDVAISSSPVDIGEVTISKILCTLSQIPSENSDQIDPGRHLCPPLSYPSSI